MPAAGGLHLRPLGDEEAGEKTDASRRDTAGQVRNQWARMLPEHVAQDHIEGDLPDRRERSREVEDSRLELLQGTSLTGDEHRVNVDVETDDRLGRQGTRGQRLEPRTPRRRPLPLRVDVVW